MNICSNKKDTSMRGSLMLDLIGTTLTEDERKLLANPQVGGVILFARNVESRAQICHLTAQIREAAPEILIAVDQEGGRVQRFRVGYTEFPPMQVLGDFYQSNPAEGTELLRDCGWLLAAEVIASGVDISFAPVLDVDKSLSTIIGNRSFGEDPQRVVEAASAFMAGMHEAGMATTGKHFPGHGGIVADSHLEAPVDNRSWDEVWARDLVPFVALKDQLDGIMPAHITFPAIDGDSVGFSSHWLQTVLRGQMGFDGVIFSDDLTMKGADVVGGYIDKAKAALAAGCDMALVCNNPEGAKEVLAWLESQSHGGSHRIQRMRATQQHSWGELENHPRRLKVQHKLATIRAESK